MESFDEKRRCCKCCTLKVSMGILFAFSVLFICLGAGAIPFLDTVFKSKVKEELVLKNGSEAYDNWNNPPTPVYMQFYVFNYTNTEDVIKKSAKPRVEQLGPYSYREVRQNIIQYEDEYKITYLQNYSYVFDAATSCHNCSVNDTIIAPNIAVLTVLDQIRRLYEKDAKKWYIDYVLKGVNVVLNLDKNYTLFMKHNVNSLLWGFESGFLVGLSKLINDIPSFIRNHLDLPKLNPWIALQKNSTEGAYANGNLTILTGKENIDDVQKITQWKGRSEVPIWLTKYGRMINGTDGTHAKPFLDQDDTIYIFNSQLCRSLYLNYEKDAEIYDIDLYRYTTSKRLFEARDQNPDNFAFCEDKDHCYGSGILPVGKCQPENPPVFMSSPHFYQGDEKFWKAIDGLHPNKTLHETYLSVEPITGLVMDAHKRLQVNINARKINHIDLTNCLESNMNFLPVLFVHEFAQIDKASADKFKNQVLGAKKLMKYIEYGVIGFGGLLFVIALILGVVYQRRKTQNNTFHKFKDDTDYDDPIPIQA